MSRFSWRQCTMLEKISWIKYFLQIKDLKIKQKKIFIPRANIKFILLF